MAYQRIYNFGVEEGRGRQGYLFDTPVLFSQIFDGSPQFYVGSTITVQEILLILSQVISGQERLVDVDQRWFEPKKYLGTFQIKSSPLSEYDAEDSKGQGFLTNNGHQIVRYSNYTIVANPDTPVAAGEIYTVDNCNFALEQFSIEIAGVAVSLQRPKSNTALFSGKLSQTRAPLKDTEYNQLLGSIGLYYNPGCEGVSLVQKIAIINTIATDYDSYPNFACVPLGG